MSEKGAVINVAALILTFTGMILLELEMYVDAAIFSILALILFGISSIIKRSSGYNANPQMAFQNTQPILQQSVIQQPMNQPLQPNTFHQNQQAMPMQQQAQQQQMVQSTPDGGLLINLLNMFNSGNRVVSETMADDFLMRYNSQGNERLIGWSLFIKGSNAINAIPIFGFGNKKKRNNAKYLLECANGYNTVAKDQELQYSIDVLYKSQVFTSKIAQLKMATGNFAVPTQPIHYTVSSTPMMQAQMAQPVPQQMVQQPVQQPMPTQQFPQQQYTQQFIQQPMAPQAAIPTMPKSCANCGTNNAPNSTQCSMCLMNI